MDIFDARKLQGQDRKGDDFSVAFGRLIAEVFDSGLGRFFFLDLGSGKIPVDVRQIRELDDFFRIVMIDRGHPGNRKCRIRLERKDLARA